jgi:hypothetical protein
VVELEKVGAKKVDGAAGPPRKSSPQMSSPIVQPKNFKLAKLTVTAPRPIPGSVGAKSAYVNYGGDKNKLTFQTPSLPSPFGLNAFDNKTGGPLKHSIDLALVGYDEEGSKANEFYKALSEIDEHMISTATANSKLWFKKELSREVVENNYTRCAKFTRDKEGNQSSYPPNVKLNLRKKKDSDEFETLVFDAESRSNPNATPITSVPYKDLLTKRSEFTCLIECTSAWFAGDKFGLSWRAVHMRIDKAAGGISGYSFVDDDVEDEEEAPATKPSAASAASAASAPAAPAFVEDEDEDEEVAPAPVPTKTTATVKKVLKKPTAKP